MGHPDRVPSKPKLVLDNVFEDMDSYASATGGWDLDFRQLDPGRLRARASIIAGPTGAALRVRFNRRLHQQGCSPTGFVVFGLPDQTFSWCGVQATAGDVVNFNLKNGLDGVSEAGFTGTVLMLNPCEMEEQAAELGLEVDLHEAVSACSAWSAPGAGIQTLRRHLDEMFRTAASSRGQVEANGWMNGDVMKVLLDVLTAEQKGQRESDPITRRKSVRTALELLEDPVGLPLTVADLCRATGVSPPTLYRAFQEHLGVSPKQYLKARSLSGVRRELLAATPGALVVEIANIWGFWHMGQFAADYRRHFGELPSKTLVRR
jgi:AraC-like DNA-binding protein